MTYPVDFYVDENGQTYGASETDQAYTREKIRTVNGRPVAYAGKWFACQIPYRPFQRAVIEASRRALQSG